jgi:hypothetical protein
VWGRLVSVLLVASVLGLAGCSSGSESNERGAAPAQPAQLADLDSVLDLRAAFNDDRGKPRLLLLLAPT